MKYIICSKCKKKKNVRHARYKQLLANHQNNRAELKSSYVCRECKLLQAIKLVHGNLLSVKPSIQQLPEYETLQKNISILASNLHVKGIQHVQNRKEFFDEVKKLLDAQFIRDFTIDILDNKVTAIGVKNIPFIGDHKIEIRG